MDFDDAGHPHNVAPLYHNRSKDQRALMPTNFPTASAHDLSPKLLNLAPSVVEELRTLRFYGDATPETPIPGKRLAEKFSIPDTDLRAIIAYCRLTREPIGSNGRGYWYAMNNEELKSTIQQFAERASALTNVRLGLESARF
jgi:hypothetical protein